MNLQKKFVKNLNQDSFDWYVADENGVWHCKLCRSCKLNNAYARGHSKPGKTTNHTRHAECKYIFFIIFFPEQYFNMYISGDANRVIPANMCVILIILKSVYLQLYDNKSHSQW